MVSYGARRTRPTFLIWFVLVIVVIAVAAVWVVGPLRSSPPGVSVLALGTDGRFGADIRVEPLDTASSALRFPVIIGLFNEGPRPYRPVALHLSIPARFRLVSMEGNTIESSLDDGGPLVQYTLPLPADPVEPGALPSVVPSTSRLQLQFARPALACRFENGVPMFSAAPPYSRTLLSRAEIFWSVETEHGGRRNTGVLTVSFDSARVDPPARLRARFGPVVVERPDASVPEFEIVALDAARQTECGEPGRAQTIDAAVWRTATGFFIVLTHRGVPRKHLFDLNGDSIVELERWDIDGDGHFEAKRTAEFPLPDELLPPPPDTAVTDSVTAHSASTDSTVQPERGDTLRDDTLGIDTVGARRDTTRTS